jgi:hypothetical protein
VSVACGLLNQHHAQLAVHRKCVQHNDLMRSDSTQRSLDPLVATGRGDHPTVHVARGLGRREHSADAIRDALEVRPLTQIASCVEEIPSQLDEFALNGGNLDTKL